MKGTTLFLIIALIIGVGLILTGYLVISFALVKPPANKPSVELTGLTVAYNRTANDITFTFRLVNNVANSTLAQVNFQAWNSTKPLFGSIQSYILPARSQTDWTAKFSLNPNPPGEPFQTRVTLLG